MGSESFDPLPLSPSQTLVRSVAHENGFPLTVARPHRLLTGFPFRPSPGHLKRSPFLVESVWRCQDRVGSAVVSYLGVKAGSLSATDLPSSTDRTTRSAVCRAAHPRFSTRVCCGPPRSPWGGRSDQSSSMQTSAYRSPFGRVARSDTSSAGRAISQAYICFPARKACFTTTP
jgi:hypothetical protein